MKKSGLVVIFSLMAFIGYSQNIYQKNGNVGIGIQNPSYKLHIKGSGVSIEDEKYGLYFIPKASNFQNNTSTIVAKDRPLSLTTDAHRDIYFSTFYSGQGLDIKMTIKGNGRVGIGIEDPKETLTVRGVGATLGIYDTNVLSKANNRFGRYSNSLVIQNDKNGTWKDNVVFHDNGNVGIGTTTPNHKLDVKGTICTQELRVDMQGADFVFENNYQLRSLEEVETFIKDNKHLPEIAPAKEMQKNGVNQSEMNQKLLQKIEELTLYIIQMQKVIVGQEKRIKCLEK